jgi:hypothetical protein
MLNLLSANILKIALVGILYTITFFSIPILFYSDGINAFLLSKDHLKNSIMLKFTE